tara:strand:- start:276 stop:1310 length:1035 start_codon:yes stop_codon:yes gene_type:complete
MSYSRYGIAAAADAYTTGDFRSLSDTTQASSAPDTTKYIPTLYAGKLLVKFYEASVLSAIANTEYEGQIKNQGDAVIIRKLPTLTIEDHTKGLKLTHQNPEVDSVTLEINKGKYWAFVTDDVDNVQTDIKNWISEWTTDAAYELRNTIEKDVIQSVVEDSTIGIHIGGGSDGKTVTTGSSTQEATAFYLNVSGADILDLVIEAGQQLDENNVPDDGRYFLMSPAMISKVKKSDLADANKSGDPVSMKRNGQVGIVDRFTIYRTNNLRVDSGEGTSDNDKITYALFGHSVGITFATQLIKNEMIPNPDGFGMLHRGLQVYGFKVVKPEAIGVAYVAAEAAATQGS